MALTDYERGRRHAFEEMLAHVSNCAVGNMLFMFEFPKAPRWQFLSSKYGEIDYLTMGTALKSMMGKPHRTNLKDQADHRSTHDTRLAKLGGKKRGKR